MSNDVSNVERLPPLIEQCTLGGRKTLARLAAQPDREVACNDERPQAAERGDDVAIVERDPAQDRTGRSNECSAPNLDRTTSAHSRLPILGLERVNAR